MIMDTLMPARLLLGMGERLSRLEKHLCAVEKFLFAFVLVAFVLFLLTLI